MKHILETVLPGYQTGHEEVKEVKYDSHISIFSNWKGSY